MELDINTWPWMVKMINHRIAVYTVMSGEITTGDLRQGLFGKSDWRKVFLSFIYSSVWRQVPCFSTKNIKNLNTTKMITHCEFYRLHCWINENMELIYIFRFSTPNEKEAMYVHPIAFDKLRDCYYRQKFHSNFSINKQMYFGASEDPIVQPWAWG